MGILKNFDEKHQNSTVWQFVKFNLVSISISLLQLLLPHGQSEEEIKTRYESFARQQRRATDAFLAGTREQKENLTEKKGSSPAEDPEAFIFSAATVSAFSRLLAERLILLKQDADGEKEVP